MTKSIRIGVAGYGNLGKGVVAALQKTADLTLTGIFTRRDPAKLNRSDNGIPFYPFPEITAFRQKIDVLILCGSSKDDLPTQAPAMAKLFNIVDSFDTHAKIPEHFTAVHAAAKPAGTSAIISSGWDPGLFSLHRLLGEAILPDGQTESFWGPGISQGHSTAIRKVPGVRNGIQYTTPNPAAIEAVRKGEFPSLSNRDKHQRNCFVVPEPDADLAEIKRAIITMPDYFADFNTTVTFVSEEELLEKHSGMPHGGFVIRSGKTGSRQKQITEFSLKLESNPEFTASVLVATARAAYRLHLAGSTGAHTIFDIPPAYFSPKSPETLRQELL